MCETMYGSGGGERFVRVASGGSRSETGIIGKIKYQYHVTTKQVPPTILFFGITKITPIVTTNYIFVKVTQCHVLLLLIILIPLLLVKYILNFVNCIFNSC